MPVVVRMPPTLDDGTPFPTRYWLTCPLAVSRLGRIAGSGGARAMDRWVAADPGLVARMAAAGERYAADRDADWREGPRPVGGVGGIPGAGLKCLHAHYGDHAAGNDNPVGETVAPWVEPLDCTVPCVAGGARNPEWSEPG